MNVKKEGMYALIGIIGLYILVIVLFLSSTSLEYFEYNFFIRFFALTGFYFLAISVLLTPFVREVYQVFGKPFQSIHHSFGALGLAGATIHPLVYAVQVSDISVFVPDFSGWTVFWELAGRPAFFIIYIALIGAFFRRNIGKYWRSLHSLMYLALVFIFVHGYLIGTDFDNLGVMIIFTGLFAASMVAPFYKRYNQK
ncbi:MAG: hypothetical protein ACOC85_05020 [Thermoplasmatota archaeon]